MRPEVLSREYSDVSITAAMKAFVTLSKASRFLKTVCAENHPWPCNIVEIAYFAVIFLIRSIHSLCFRVTSARSLHRPFMSSFYQLVHKLSSYLIKSMPIRKGGLNQVLAAELLCAPFYMCVSSHSVVIFAVVTRHIVAHQLQRPRN